MMGRLIAFEGADGCGKSTQARLLAERLGAVLTRQAGGTPFGERLREMLLSVETSDISARAEALLYMADRAEHVSSVVLPALKLGKTVVSDRWAYSSLVYQGNGRGLDRDELTQIAEWSMEGLWPDLVIWIDVSLDEARERRRLRGGDADRFESEGDALQTQVVEGYRSLVAAEPHRWVRISGAGMVEDVAEDVWRVVEQRFGLASASAN